MWLGGQRERRWIPGTGRTDRRTTVGTAGSASYLQRIGEVSDAWKGAGFEKQTHLVKKKKQTAIFVELLDMFVAYLPVFSKLP